MASQMWSGEIMDDGGEEEFIEMEMSSCIVKLSNKPSGCSSFHCREFEFQVSSKPVNLNELLPITSSADELFYKGNLLPLHLSPCLSTARSVGSCKISPCESHNVSREVDPSNNVINVCHTMANENSINSLGRKIKPPSLALKYKAYVKGLFRRNNSSDQSSSPVAPATTVAGRKSFSEVNQSARKIQTDKNKLTAYNDSKVKGMKLSGGRRSFSEALKRSLTPRSSSPPTLSFSIGVQECQYLNRRDCELAEAEKSIEGAIAHCKQSQSESHFSHGFHSIRTTSKVGFCAL
uniref:Membrane-associated kinase regulator 4 n=1 Tax=Kalanchoe fedtschenkoi TaxID=63787 RepID=A0A7N0UCZ9_KALFE